MQFCPECRFLTYTKLNKDKTQLLNYCKTCSWEGYIENTDNSVYKRNYQEDFIADKIVTNKYTIFDVSLPRVEYECTNPLCYTRQDIDKNLCFMINGLSEDDFDEDVISLFDEIKESMSVSPIRIRLSSLLVQAKSDDDRIKLIEFCKKDSKFRDYQIAEILTPPKKEVLYLKYDSINMKYLYMCVNCGTSWKKN